MKNLNSRKIKQINITHTIITKSTIWSTDSPNINPINFATQANVGFKFKLQD